MNIWTIQKKEIIDMVKSGSTWYPDKNKEGVNDLELCYEAATEIINDLNHTNYKGTVFTMAKSDGSHFSSAEELKEEFEKNGTLLGFISKNGKDLRCDGNLLVRLHYQDDINPAALDISAFTALSDYLTLGINAFFQPRIMFDARKSGMLPMEKMKEVYTAWKNGQKPILLFNTCSTILQLHYGFIAPENLTGEEYPADILQI